MSHFPRPFRFSFFLLAHWLLHPRLKPEPQVGVRQENPRVWPQAEMWICSLLRQPLSECPGEVWNGELPQRRKSRGPVLSHPRAVCQDLHFDLLLRASRQVACLRLAGQMPGLARQILRNQGCQDAAASFSSAQANVRRSWSAGDRARRIRTAATWQFKVSGVMTRLEV